MQPTLNESTQAPLKQNLSIVYQPTSALQSYPRNARTHSKRQIRQIADSIEAFGFTNPILIDTTDTIVAGHGRLRAAQLLSIDRVPTIRLEKLSEDQIRAYILADNKLAEKAGWDESILAIELQHLMTVDLASTSPLQGLKFLKLT
jgi:ParB-like chromosome segregation protein Spo0J